MQSSAKNPYLMTLPSLISAKNKLSKIAENYDPNRYSLKGFDSQNLTPTQFRQQLMRNFRVNLSDAELGALITLFDADGEHTVDSMEFINEFFRLGKLERKKVLKEKRDRVQKQLASKKALEDKRAEANRKYVDSHVTDSWSQEEEDSAIKKLTKAAFQYDTTRGGLEAFIKFEFLDAVEFREQLKSNLDTKLTIGETSALINLFGSLEEKIVYCREFLNNFFRIRRMELDKYNRIQSEITKQRHDQQIHRLEDVVEKYCKLTVAKKEPFTEEDKASAIDKLRSAAAHRRPNPFINAIERSFEASELTPTAFKELIKNNFYVKLTPGELDAMVDLFDRNSDGSISCPEFMRTFYRIGFEEHARILEEKRNRAAYLHRKEIERREKRVQSAIALVRTNVVWPQLPPSDGEEYEGFSTASPNTATDNSSFAGSSIHPKRKSKRLTVAALLTPNHLVERLAKSDISLTKLFPKASDETKDFILQIEEQDRAISKLKRAGIAGKSSKGGKGRHGTVESGNGLSPIASRGSEEADYDSLGRTYPRGRSQKKASLKRDDYEEDELMEYVPPPADFYDADRPRTVHSSRGSSRNGTVENTHNLSYTTDEFYSDMYDSG